MLPRKPHVRGLADVHLRRLTAAVKGDIGRRARDTAERLCHHHVLTPVVVSRVMAPLDPEASGNRVGVRGQAAKVLSQSTRTFSILRGPVYATCGFARGDATHQPHAQAFESPARSMTAVTADETRWTHSHGVIDEGPGPECGGRTMIRTHILYPALGALAVMALIVGLANVQGQASEHASVPAISSTTAPDSFNGMLGSNQLFPTAVES